MIQNEDLDKIMSNDWTSVLMCLTDLNVFFVPVTDVCILDYATTFRSCQICSLSVPPEKNKNGGDNVGMADTVGVAIVVPVTVVVALFDGFGVFVGATSTAHGFFFGVGVPEEVSVADTVGVAITITFTVPVAVAVAVDGFNVFIAEGVFTGLRVFAGVRDFDHVGVVDTIGITVTISLSGSKVEAVSVTIIEVVISSAGKTEMSQGSNVIKLEGSEEKTKDISGVNINGTDVDDRINVIIVVTILFVVVAVFVVVVVSSSWLSSSSSSLSS